MDRFDALPLEIQFKIIKETVKFPFGIQPYENENDYNDSLPIEDSPEITSHKRYTASMVDSIKKNLLAHENNAIRRETFNMLFQQNVIEMDLYALEQQCLLPTKKIIRGEILYPKEWIRNIVLRIQLGDESDEECLWGPFIALHFCPQLETVHLKITWDVKRKKFSHNPEKDRFFAIVQARRSLIICKDIKARFGNGFSVQMVGPRDGQRVNDLAWAWGEVTEEVRLKCERGLATEIEMNTLMLAYWESREVPVGI